MHRALYVAPEMEVAGVVAGCRGVTSTNSYVLTTRKISRLTNAWFDIRRELHHSYPTLSYQELIGTQKRKVRTV